MTRFLIDTNVISELAKPAPHPGVVAFLATQHDQWLSTIVLHEIEWGLQLQVPGRRRNGLRDWLSELVVEYENRILPVGRREAKWAALLRAQARRSGRVLRLADALIAGTARANDLAIATRNVKDFDSLDIAVTNPWETI